MADEVEKKSETTRELSGSELTRREGHFTDAKKQSEWSRATEFNRVSRFDSATHECLSNEQISALKDRGLGQKFEITGLSASENLSAEDNATVIEYEPQEIVPNRTFALGLSYVGSREKIDVYKTLADFATAAGNRALDPDEWKAYIQAELDKMIGVGEGANIAKESTKSTVVAGWNALTDGTVATFLAKPNAINDPLFHTVGGVLTAMAEDPNVVNHALERLGESILSGSEHYAALSNREKGHVIGEAMFALLGPEGMQPLNPKTAEQLGLASMQESELVQLGIRRLESSELRMPELPPELRTLDYQPEELLTAMARKGRTFSIATKGSEDYRRLELMNAQGGAIGNHITLRESARKITALEEFLHGTQRRLPSFHDVPDSDCRGTR